MFVFHLQKMMRKSQATVKEAKEGQDAVAKATEVLKDPVELLRSGSCLIEGLARRWKPANMESEYEKGLETMMVAHFSTAFS